MNKQTTPINTEETKAEFISVFKDKITREGADKLLDYLEKSDFFTAPASSRFHNSCPGGLCRHSLNVYYCLKEYYEHYIKECFPSFEYSEESLAVAALLHDLCKIENYRTDYRNVKNEEGIWERVPYYVTDDKLPYGHGEKSVYIASAFIKLTRPEAMAIRWHMGFSEEGKMSFVGKAFEQFPLAFMLSVSDMNATYYVEV